MIERLVFALVATPIVFGALMAVRTRNLVHGVLWLGMTLAGTAVFYLLLSGPFLAVIQIILYTGGIMTLMLFGVMLTRCGPELDGVMLANQSRGRRRAIPVVAVVGALLVYGIEGSTKQLEAFGPTPTQPVNTAVLGQSLLGPHLLAFEVISVLLLVVMIAGIVLARRKDPSLELVDSPRARAAALPGSTQAPGQEV